MPTSKKTFLPIATAALAILAFAALGSHVSTPQQRPLLAGTGLLLIAIPRDLLKRKRKSGLFLVPQKTRVSSL